MMLAENFTPCTALLANRPDLAWVNYWLGAPVEPMMTSLWAGSNRRLFQPNPLSYLPQVSLQSTTQHMVSSSSCRQWASMHDSPPSENSDLQRPSL